MKVWIKFLKDFSQKAKKEGDKDLEFKEGDIIAVEEAFSKSLIELGFAEQTEEPEVDDLEGAFENLQKGLSEGLEKVVSQALEGIGEKLEKGVIPNFAQPKNHDEEGMRGFKDEEQFWKSVCKATSPGIYNFEVGNGVELLQKAPSGQSVQVDSEGGFQVPDTMANQIWTNVEDDPAGFLGKTDRWTTPGDSLTIPRMFEPSRKKGTGQRFAGIDVGWIDEAGQFPTTKGTSGRMKLELHKLGAVIYATEEILTKGGRSFVDKMRSNIPKAINFTINLAFLYGTGVGQPLGIVDDDGTIVVPLEGGQGNHTILHHNISNLYHRHWRPEVCEWYLHRDMAQKLEFMYFDDDTTNKRPIFMPMNNVNTTIASGGPNVPPRRMGRIYDAPAFPTELCKDFGSKGDILVADWSQYASLTKSGPGSGVRQATSIHVRFLFEETAFRYAFEVGGKPHWTSPKEDLHGSTTRSPFVVLASRTGGGTSSGL